MSFSNRDSALKLAPYNPSVAFTIPCIGHTLQHHFAAPCYDAGILGRDYNDGSHRVRRVCGTCMGRNKPCEDPIHLQIGRTDGFHRKDLVKQHSCKFHSSISPWILISSFRGDLQHDHFQWLSLTVQTHCFNIPSSGSLKTYNSQELLPDGVQGPCSNREQIN